MALFGHVKGVGALKIVFPGVATVGAPYLLTLENASEKCSHYN